MRRAAALWRRITNRDLVRQAEEEGREFARSETKERVEVLRFLEKRSTENARDLANAGLTGRASAEQRRAVEARKKAAALKHKEVYGDDPLLDLLGGS